MATDPSFMEYLADQMNGSEHPITYRKMFGEYGMHVEGKFFAIVAHNQLFIKPTEAGRAYIQNPTEVPPYTGAKDYFLIEEKLDDRDWLAGLIHVSWEELPPPKKKKSKKGKSK